MKDNRLKIRINRPVHEVFQFVITPPNSVRWINSVVDEKTNEWPVKVGTVYKLKNENREVSGVIVKQIEPDKMIEWVSEDGNYHCRYVFEPIDKKTSEFNYYERVDKGDLEGPFALTVLEKLKSVLENGN